MRERAAPLQPQLAEPVLTQDHDLRRQLAALPEGLLVTCAGDSMLPTLRRGEQVRVHAGPIAVGDVFVFETADGQLELHRLVLALPRGLLVHLGDHSERFGFTRLDRVLGRAALPRVPPTKRTTARALLAAATAGLLRTARGLRSARRTAR